MSILSILPLAALLSTATSVQAESEPALLGGCILTSPIGEVPADLYQEGDVVATDEYGPFTKKLSVYGITLIARDDASDGFMKRVAKTIKEIFPQDERMDLALQEELIKNLYRYKTTIPVPKGRDMDFLEEDKAAWERVESQNTICDIIMELGSVPGQVMEVVEHILHFVSDVGLHYTFPNEWGISKEWKLWQAMQEAVEKGYYDISSYADIDEEDVRDRVALQEFAYWVISTAWNLQEPYGPQGEEEWTIKDAADLQAKLPVLYEVYEQTVGKIMVAPSLSTLEKFGPRTSAAEAPKYNIVYSGQAKDATELFGFNISENKTQQLTSSSSFGGFPVWSPAGDRIAFLAERDQGMDLVVMDTSSGDVSVLFPDMSNPVDWGPEGKQILITKDLDGDGRGLFIVDVTDGSEKRVETGSSEDAYARWGRSGGAITYESGRDGNPEIYRTDLETGETTRLTNNPGLDEWPSLSRNGGRIAWASGSEEEKDLWIMQADGSGKKQVTKGMLFGDAFPEWSPNGRQIMLTVREDGVFVLKVIDVETGHVTHLGEGAQPSWR
jgi:hypothetical protein